MAAAASTAPLASSSSSAPRQIPTTIGCLLVDFHHLQGPIIEWSYPSFLADADLHPDLAAQLPFCALPDGSHLSDEDFAHFHLHCPTISTNSTVFGISCNRQIASEKLLVKGKDVTRSTVQKAVVVLARQPIFAPLREKLGIVTRAFFTQGDLADTTILTDFYDTLELGLRASGLKGEEIAEDDDFTDDLPVEGEAAGKGNAEKQVDPPPLAEKKTLAPLSREELAKKRELREGVMYMGTSLRELIYKFRFKALILVKLLLLQKRIMFFGYPVERLCVYEYTLVSLIPGLLLSLSDCSDPALDYTKRKEIKVAEDVRTSDRKSLLRFCGCPLRLFGENAFFQPYLPLQQIEMLKADSWLVGTTNMIFKQQKEFRPDVIVDLEHSTLDFASPNPGSAAMTPTPSATTTVPGGPSSHHTVEPSLQSIVSLTPEDRKWMDELVQVVIESYNPSDPTRPTTMRYEGSEDWVRLKFEDYVCSMLACVKYSDFLSKGQASTRSSLGSRPSTPLGGTAPTSSTTIEAGDANVLSSYNAAFISNFKTTRAYTLWNRTTSPLLFDLVPYKHPCGGRVSTLEDVSLRLTAGLHDLRLEEQVASGREALGFAGSRLFSMANAVGAEVAKRRREWVEQQKVHQAAQVAGAAGTTAAVDAATSTAPSVPSTSSSSSGTSTTGLSPEAIAAASASSGAVDLFPAPAGSAPSSNLNPSAAAAAAAAQQHLSELSTTLAPHAAAAQQAALQASTQARAALGRFGNYLGSRGWNVGGLSGSTQPASASAAPSTATSTDPTVTSTDAENGAVDLPIRK